MPSLGAGEHEIDCRPRPRFLRGDRGSAERRCTDYRQLLSDPKLDAVEVLTPHRFHAEMSVAALAAGKHVSLQKPMAVSLAEADAIVAAAARPAKGVRVVENFRS